MWEGWGGPSHAITRGWGSPVTSLGIQPVAEGEEAKGRRLLSDYSVQVEPFSSNPRRIKDLRISGGLRRRKLPKPFGTGKGGPELGEALRCFENTLSEQDVDVFFESVICETRRKRFGSS